MPKPAESVDEKWVEGRQAQVAGLIRTHSWSGSRAQRARFSPTCEGLLLKQLAFAKVHCESPADKKRFQRWEDQNVELIQRIQESSGHW